MSSISSVRSFSELDLHPGIQKAVAAKGYVIPTPIQAQAIPVLLTGRDLLGVAQTGTGKTAAFALPILQRLATTPRPTAGPRPIRALVLAPTRELALQIKESFDTYGRELRIVCTTIFGGVGQGPQVDAIRRGVDVVVATPGRLLDLIGQRLIRFDGLQVLVLDEADRMLDMGFIHPLRQIIKVLPGGRQNLMFSATMPPEIAHLAASFLVNPQRIDVAPVATPAERVTQSVYFVQKDTKRTLLLQLLADPALSRVIVFTRTKHGANRVSETLERAGVDSAAIHGNKSQTARVKALDGFKAGRVRVLVATDIAARGIDVTEVTHVINFELPNEPESYVHRIGRTGRAGADGIAVAFCDGEERSYLRDIERLTRQKLTVLEMPQLTVTAPRASEDRGPPPRRDSRRDFGRDDRGPRPARSGGYGGGRPSAAPSGGSRPTSAPSGGGYGGGRPSAAPSGGGYGGGRPASAPAAASAARPASSGGYADVWGAPRTGSRD